MGRQTQAIDQTAADYTEHALDNLNPSASGCASRDAGSDHVGG